MKWLDSIRYRRQVDDWLARCELLDGRLTEAKKAFNGTFTFAGLQLEVGERLVGVQHVNLLETRRVRVTNYGSMAHHTKNHNTFRTGQARSESHDELRQVDQGRLVVTDRRVIYLGSKSREIRWRKLVHHTVGPGAAEFHAAGQRTPLQVTYNRSTGAEFQFIVHVAIAGYDGAESEFIDELTNQLHQLRRHAPETPAGLESDPRITPTAIGARMQPAALPTAPSPGHEAHVDDRPPLPRGQFNATSLETVAEASVSLGFSTTVAAGFKAGAEPATVDLPKLADVTPLGVDLVLFACPPEQLVDLATRLKPSWSVVVSDDPVDGITVLDDAVDEPIVLSADVVALDQICNERRDGGAAVHRLSFPSEPSAKRLNVLNTQLRLSRALTRKSQVVVIEGSVFDIETAADAFVAADEVILASADVEVLEEDPTADRPTQILDDVGPLTVAGVAIAAPAQRLREYLVEHAGTVVRYDKTGGTFPAVTTELIAATRVLRSRISRDEEAWFIERAGSAPWDSVPATAQLVDADPCEAGALYDNASKLYEHFRAHAPKGVKAAKIYKVLHLMRPGLFPILDSRLAKLYDAPARAMAPVVNNCRPDLPASKYAYWAAIRVDLRDASDTIEAIRRVLRESGDDFVAATVDELTNLRILDMLAWQDVDQADD